MPAATAKDDPFGLEKFVSAQSSVYPIVVGELSLCRKVTHWMWFIFPQFAGLGHSALSQKFAIRSIEEASAYMAHGILGSRLTECTELVCRCPHRSVRDIFYGPDDLKFHSSMTLFGATSRRPEFAKALAMFFDGEGDAATLALIQESARRGR